MNAFAQIDSQVLQRVSPSDFLNSGGIIKNLVCELCKFVLHNPVMDSCNHNFCSECLTKHFKVSNICPISREIFSSKSMIPNDLITKILEEETVNCRNRRKGCLYKGKYKEIYVHLKECDFHVVKCPNEGCLSTITRAKMEEHAKECSQRVVKCDACRVELTKNALLFHDFTCSEKKVKCAGGCEEYVKRKNLEVHQCVNKKWDCPFKLTGCGFKTKNEEEMKDHINNHPKTHETLVEMKLTHLNSFLDGIDKMQANLYFLGKKKINVVPSEYKAISDKLTLMCNSTQLNTKGFSWTVNVGNFNSWGAFGVCNKELLKYRECVTKSLLHKNSYLLDCNGYLWRGEEWERVAPLYSGASLRFTYSLDKAERLLTLSVVFNSVQYKIFGLKSGEYFPCFVSADLDTFEANIKK